MSKILSGLAALIVCAAWQSEARASITFDFAEVGADVVLTLSGSANTSGLLGGFSTANVGDAAFIVPSSQAVLLTTTGPVDSFQGVSGPSDFGSGGFALTFSVVNPVNVGLLASKTLNLPGGYVSGTPLSSSATFSAASFASLGMTPGTYTWTWGGGSVATGQALVVNVGPVAPIPEPSSLALFCAGAIALVAARSLWRRPEDGGQPAAT